LAAIVWFRARPDSVVRLLVVAAALGIAISLKYSGMFLLAVLSAMTEYDVLAVSATFLQGAYVRGDPFADFRQREPMARIGNSILLYRLTH
jgi:hypothetical protein